VIKYLGVIFDNKLSFHGHTQYVLNKMSQKVYLLSRIGKNFNIYVYQMLIIQADSRSPFIRNFLISQNHINMKIGS
jgi:hypothetical protein